MPSVFLITFTLFLSLFSEGLAATLSDDFKDLLARGPRDRCFFINALEQMSMRGMMTDENFLVRTLRQTADLTPTEKERKQIRALKEELVREWRLRMDMEMLPSDAGVIRARFVHPSPLQGSVVEVGESGKLSFVPKNAADLIQLSRFPEIARGVWMVDLSHPDFWPNSTAKDVAQLISLPVLDTVGGLRLPHMASADDRVLPLLASPRLADLQELVVEGGFNNPVREALPRLFQNLRSLTVRGAGADTKDLSAAMEGHPQLEVLNMSGARVANEVVAQMGVAFPQLKELDLSETDVGDRGLTALIRALPQLRSLNLRGTRAGDLTLVTLGGHARNLQELDLSGTRITSSSGPALSHLLSLEVLRLSRTDIGNSVASHLSALPQLRHLNLNGTRVGDPGVTAIARGLSNLQVFYLRGCPVTDRSAKALFNMTKLEALDLSLTRISTHFKDANRERLRTLRPGYIP